MGKTDVRMNDNELKRILDYYGELANESNDDPMNDNEWDWIECEETIGELDDILQIDTPPYNEQSGHLVGVVKKWKYQPLKDFLKNSKNTMETLSFQELENILGFALPESAYVQPAWWANGTANPLSQQRAWVEAGWKVVDGTRALRYNEVTFCKKRVLLHDIFDYFNCPLPHNVHNKDRLKTLYEKMLNQYDASKLNEMGFAQELVELAKAKTKEIKEMYERAQSYFKSCHSGSYPN